MTEKIPRQEMPDRRLHLKYVGPSTVVGAAAVVAFQNSGQGLNTGVTSMTTDVRRSKQEIIGNMKNQTSRFMPAY